MKLNMRQFFKNISDGCTKHAPAIFTGLGIAGMGATMYTVYKLAPKMNEKLAENPNATTWEKTKTVASVYWPSMLSFASSAGLILWSNRIQSKRVVAWASTAAFAQKELMNFQEAAVEKIGKDTVQEIRERVAERKAEETPTPQQDQVITMGYLNKQLYVDEISGRKFFSNDQLLFNAQNELNGQMLRGMDSASVNQWWNAIGLESTSIGDQLGWSVSNGSGRLIDIDTSFRGTDKETGMKYILLAYNNPPRFDYEG